MQTITRQQAEAIFAAIAGTAFVGITTVTVPRLKGGKSNEMQGRVKKHATASVFCGEAPSYKDMLETKAFAEFRETDEGAELTADEIEVTPLQVEGLWKGNGEKLSGAVIRHKTSDARYIGVYFPKNAKPQVAYTLDGEPIDKDDIEGLEESKPTEKTVEVNGESVTVKIVPRVYKMASLVSFRHDGEEYEIVAEVEGGEIAASNRDQDREEPREEQA
jgi:hypothetical protein